MFGIRKLTKGIKNLHNDEDGMETLQVVMIVGIGAVILIVLIAFWKEIKTWTKEKMGKVTSDADATAP